MELNRMSNEISSEIAKIFSLLKDLKQDDALAKKNDDTMPEIEDD